jgi:hypothetical protein
VGYFDLEGRKDGFFLFRSLGRDENQPRFVDFLVENAKFILTEQRLKRECVHSEIISVIDELRNGLGEFTEGEG